MPSDKDKAAITNLICDSIRQKLQNHNPEPAQMPFHTRLLGKQRLALYSFIHSLNTNFGTTIFEPVAIYLARKKFPIAEKQFNMPNRISKKAQDEIQAIINSLTVGQAEPDKLPETERIRSVCRQGEMKSISTPRVDIYLKKDEIFLIDLKTAKPNKSSFLAYKRTLLEWIAVFLAREPDAKVHSLVAIPYNPEAPNPYRRWTMKGMLDLEHELKVGEDLWDFLAGESVYEFLLECFEEAGVRVRPELDAYFLRFDTKTDNKS